LNALWKEENLLGHWPAGNEYSGDVKEGPGALISQFYGRLLISQAVSELTTPQ